MASPLYVGIKGTVLALDRATGAEIWRTHLKGSEFVNVVLSDGDLLAATGGELFLIDIATGQIRWHNRLKGLGFGLVTVAPACSAQQPASAAKRRKDQAAASAAAIS
jgi:outer membrane protein assembly factor BamB